MQEVKVKSGKSNDSRKLFTHLHNFAFADISRVEYNNYCSFSFGVNRINFLGFNSNKFQFSVSCRKTKTKVVILINQNSGGRRFDESIKARSKYTRASISQLVSILFLIG